MFLVMQLDSKKKEDLNIGKEETKFVLYGSDEMVQLKQPRKLT